MNATQQTQTEPTPEDSGVRAALWGVALVGLATAAAAGLLVDTVAMLSVAAGAAVGVANLWMIARIVRSFLGGGTARGSWTAFAVLKFSLLMGGVYLLLTRGSLEVLPLAIGYASLPVGIFTTQLRPAAKQPHPKPNAT